MNLKTQIYNAANPNNATTHTSRNNEIRAEVTNLILEALTKKIKTFYTEAEIRTISTEIAQRVTQPVTAYEIELDLEGMYQEYNERSELRNAWEPAESISNRAEEARADIPYSHGYQELLAKHRESSV